MTDGSCARPESAVGAAAALAACVAFAGAMGAAAGLVWGGIGGRIAMRVVFLTSDEHLRGLTSDDGFEIGTITAASVFLLFFTAILGGTAGLVVGLIRTITSGPTWTVATGFALASAAFFGAGIVHTDGVDFRFLDPLWLTVGLFVLLPGLWGASVVVATDLLMRASNLTRPERHGPLRALGAIGWIVLVSLTVLGVTDLVADIDELRVRR